MTNRWVIESKQLSRMEGNGLRNPKQLVLMIQRNQVNLLWAFCFPKGCVLTFLFSPSSASLGYMDTHVTAAILLKSLITGKKFIKLSLYLQTQKSSKGVFQFYLGLKLICELSTHARSVSQCYE